MILLLDGIFAEGLCPSLEQAADSSAWEMCRDPSALRVRPTGLVL